VLRLKWWYNLYFFLPPHRRTVEDYVAFIELDREVRRRVPELTFEIAVARGFMVVGVSPRYRRYPKEMRVKTEAIRVLGKKYGRWTGWAMFHQQFKVNTDEALAVFKELFKERLGLDADKEAARYDRWAGRA